jgi:hypothetical protein
MTGDKKFLKLMEVIGSLLKGREFPTQPVETKIIGTFRIVLQ